MHARHWASLPNRKNMPAFQAMLRGQQDGWAGKVLVPHPPRNLRSISRTTWLVLLSVLSIRMQKKGSNPALKKSILLATMPPWLHLQVLLLLRLRVSHLHFGFLRYPWDTKDWVTQWVSDSQSPSLFLSPPISLSFLPSLSCLCLFRLFAVGETLCVIPFVFFKWIYKVNSSIIFA